jgi:3-oxoacyl-[acyl-carrier protein] reductase
MADLNGRIALVTGASRGIGRAIAIRLARAGADVAANFRVNETEAKNTLEQVTSTGRRGIILQADVSKKDDIYTMVKTVEKELGDIDVLVNNAAIARHQAMEEITETDWDEVLDVNLKSVFLVTQAFLPGMRKRRWGRIINISSGAAQTGGIVGLHYTASKAGIEGLTRAYASRLVKEGITVNAVAPALIKTDMIRDAEGREKLIPMGRLGQTEEVADAVVFVASNAYMTGQTLHLNGGLYFR